MRQQHARLRVVIACHHLSKGTIVNVAIGGKLSSLSEELLDLGRAVSERTWTSRYIRHRLTIGGYDVAQLVEGEVEILVLIEVKERILEELHLGLSRS